MILLKDWLVAAKKQVSSTDAELILLWALNRDGKKPSSGDNQKSSGRESLDRTELFLLADENETFPNKKTKQLADNVLAKRAEGMPLAYIVGKREFYGREFLVNQHVLIPRPETETTIDLLKENSSKLRDYNLLDIGTGSGCIAITASLEIPQIKEVFATDISSNALEVTKNNIARMEASIRSRNDNDLQLAEKTKHDSLAKIRLYQADLLDDEQLMRESNFRNRPVVVVANLPYVDKKWDWLNLKALSYEPESALFAERNGLEKIYRIMSEFIANCCKKYNNYLYLEADICQHEAIIKYAEGLGLQLAEQRGYIIVFETQIA